MYERDSYEEIVIIYYIIAWPNQNLRDNSHIIILFFFPTGFSGRSQFAPWKTHTRPLHIHKTTWSRSPKRGGAPARFPAGAHATNFQTRRQPTWQCEYNFLVAPTNRARGSWASAHTSFILNALASCKYHSDSRWRETVCCPWGVIYN